MDYLFVTKLYNNDPTETLNFDILEVFKESLNSLPKVGSRP